SARGIEEDALRVAEGRRPCRAAVTRTSKAAIAGDGPDDAGPRVDPPDAVVPGVGDEAVAGQVECNSARQVEARRRCEFVVAGETWRSAAGYRRNETRGKDDLPYPVVLGIGDEQVVEIVERDSLRKRELRRGCGSAVAREALLPSAGHGYQDAGSA